MVWVSHGCPSKVPQTGCLEQQKCITQRPCALRNTWAAAPPASSSFGGSRSLWCSAHNCTAPTPGHSPCVSVSSSDHLLTRTPVLLQHDYFLINHICCNPISDQGHSEVLGVISFFVEGHNLAYNNNLTILAFLTKVGDHSSFLP